MYVVVWHHYKRYGQYKVFEYEYKYRIFALLKQYSIWLFYDWNRLDYVVMYKHKEK